MGVNLMVKWDHAYNISTVTVAFMRDTLCTEIYIQTSDLRVTARETALEDKAVAEYVESTSVLHSSDRLTCECCLPCYI